MPVRSELCEGANAMKDFFLDLLARLLSDVPLLAGLGILMGVYLVGVR